MPVKLLFRYYYLKRVTHLNKLLQILSHLKHIIKKEDELKNK